MGLAVLTSVRRFGFRQRGFTLVELAIALAVVGLVLGATLIPLRALDEIRRVKDEQRRLEVVRDAIVGYALRHRTRARTIRFEYDPVGYTLLRRTPHSAREFRLPAGRPYLPCPDWDGDGFEDRHPEHPGGFGGAGGFAQGMEVSPGRTVTTQFTGPFPHQDEPLEWNPRPLLLEFFVDGAPYGAPYGECRMSRGAVPWRTLGVSPTDGWGNRHTYFVDPVFSNAMFGFDRQTIADIYDPRFPRVPGMGPVLRLIRGLHFFADQFASQFIFSPVSLILDCPAAVCDSGRSAPGDCADHNINGHPIIEDCGWTRHQTLMLKAGAATREKIDDGWRIYPPGSVADGLPFVLVSHGPNGHFAVNHWATLNRPADSKDRLSPVCNISAAKFTAAPVPFHSVSALDRALVREALNGARLSPSDESCPPMFRSDIGNSKRQNFSFFVWEPPGTAGTAPLDDLLATRN